MSPNTKVVGRYFASRGTDYGRLLADDVELVEWGDGVPVTGIRTHGKAAFLENRGNRDYRTQVTRMTEENNVVVAEGTAQGAKKEGGVWRVQFCDIFELEDGKVRRLTTFGASVEASARGSPGGRVSPPRQSSTSTAQLLPTSALSQPHSRRRPESTGR